MKTVQKVSGFRKWLRGVIKKVGIGPVSCGNSCEPLREHLQNMDSLV